MSTPLHIEVVSDIVCPWCYIGKRRLEAALKLFAAKHPSKPAPKISWLPFQLNPSLPPAGMSRADYLQRKFGSADGGGMYERVKSEGAKEGIAFAFERIERQPNTLKLHALVAVAAQFGLQDALKEAFMQAYFIDALDMTSDVQIARVAVGAGLSIETIHATITSREALQSASKLDAELRSQGITGVPFFLFNRQLAVSGAQDAQVLLQAIEQASGSPQG
jgi:predicted DsbA family dithiol-disulfide isomerase